MEVAVFLKEPRHRRLSHAAHACERYMRLESTGICFQSNSPCGAHVRFIKRFQLRAHLHTRPQHARITSAKSTRTQDRYLEWHCAHLGKLICKVIRRTRIDI